MSIDQKYPPSASPETLREMAAILRERATVMLREADRREKMQSGRIDNTKMFAQLRAAGRVAFERAEANGHDLDSTSIAVAAETDIPVLTVLSWARSARIEIGRERRAIRDREIMRLAASGWTNDRIAARFSLSPKTISRAVAKARRATGI